MNLLASPWFFSMVEKRGSSPKQRLLAVFSISRDWLAAPGIGEQFSLEINAAAHQSIQHLSQFLTRLAEAAKATNPAVLSNQLSLLLIGAITEQQRNPQSPVMEEAMHAAQVLIDMACKRNHTKHYAYLGGFAASVMACFLGWKLLMPNDNAPIMHVAGYPLHIVQANHLSPDEVEAVLALHSQILSGECRAPHLAMLPQGQMSAYMNVIEFRKPDDPVADEANIRAFMTWFSTIHATECYPHHTNDHINTVWVRKGMS
ncbi:MAG: hypothetical protein K8Q92_00010 [Methylophilales bacterium]|nr:hypothetical protein [Methylophilales bacterium]